ncbi:MAG TPA: hypothetical protein QGI07_04050 [Dehalococcoidia bacterium]|jgi:uncharacterized membrane protein|nr:hypothetical protein [Chloroflexota bacterium]MDP5877253.1 hypothetical protein [Dehalococcoidia bacterium]MDP6274057.1 hypothetical protein [Dehalococcoidia bacterium]MDP7159914.1 hypothetical protein [Dehalococcoidia bacterium]MDP7212470.1 hypothetical protein [Dehalococcoidia bacterium]|tara:strand:+ start:2846 stop:3328 length:483 start_codon:yes stop_codon:yes gene_type:complete
MFTELPILRILHIIPGVIWVGSAVFLAFILNPRLRVLEPEIEKTVTTSINKTWSPVVHGSAVTTIVVGFVLVSRTPGRDFGQLFDNGWGWSIGIGLVAAIVALLFGGLAGFTQARGRRENEGSRDLDAMAALDSQISVYEKLHALLALVAVGAMAAARWV